ncbi:hypothetical protein DFH08DRAFT_817445 [Mycena albidolilacea]|uniref:Uncharacterized protein n=1 Tax=Mycena albidolilacea TaxID=1033008 RepID=A0AAD6ZIK2_9AGAR|nr:hypothetical protein DFH08DRAFT_817445 [Mycena albidolilacea]
MENGHGKAVNVSQRRGGEPDDADRRAISSLRREPVSQMAPARDAVPRGLATKTAEHAMRAGNNTSSTLRGPPWWPAVLKAVESTSCMWATSFWAEVERRPRQVEAAERSYRIALPRIHRERLVGRRGRNQPTNEQDGRASVGRRERTTCTEPYAAHTATGVRGKAWPCPRSVMDSVCTNRKKLADAARIQGGRVKNENMKIFTKPRPPLPTRCLLGGRLLESTTEGSASGGSIQTVKCSLSPGLTRGRCRIHLADGERISRLASKFLEIPVVRSQGFKMLAKIIGASTHGGNVARSVHATAGMHGHYMRCHVRRRSSFCLHPGWVKSSDAITADTKQRGFKEEMREAGRRIWKDEKARPKQQEGSAESPKPNRVKTESTSIPPSG